MVAGGPGSVTDIRARWLAQRPGEALGQAVVVENNGAAGGNVGAAQVARAAPDGHTLLMTHQGIAAINPHLYASPGYDALRDFVAVARFGIGALLLVVPAARRRFAERHIEGAGRGAGVARAPAARRSGRWSTLTVAPAKCLLLSWRQDLRFAVCFSTFHLRWRVRCPC